MISHNSYIPSCCSSGFNFNDTYGINETSQCQTELLFLQLAYLKLWLMSHRQLYTLLRWTYSLIHHHWKISIREKGNSFKTKSDCKIIVPSRYQLIVGSSLAEVLEKNMRWSAVNSHLHGFEKNKCYCFLKFYTASLQPPWVAPSSVTAMNMNSHTCPTPPLSWECHTVASTLSLLYIDRQERSEVIGKSRLMIQPEFLLGDFQVSEILLSTELCPAMGRAIVCR